MTQYQAGQVINRIKATYPASTRYQGCDTSGEAYCVGGALMRYNQPWWVRWWRDWFVGYKCDEGYNFPFQWEIADVLEEMNPDIDGFSAMSMAEAIIDSNDQGEIQEAWDFAEEALSINKGGNYVDDPSKNPAEVGCGDCAG